MAESHEHITLRGHISCRNLPCKPGQTSCSPVVAVYAKRESSGKLEHVAQTDNLVDTCNPVFDTAVEFVHDGPGASAQLCIYDMTGVDAQVGATAEDMIGVCKMNLDNLLDSMADPATARDGDKYVLEYRVKRSRAPGAPRSESTVIDNCWVVLKVEVADMSPAPAAASSTSAQPNAAAAVEPPSPRKKARSALAAAAAAHGDALPHLTDFAAHINAHIGLHPHLPPLTDPALAASGASLVASFYRATPGQKGLLYVGQTEDVQYPDASADNGDVMIQFAQDIQWPDMKLGERMRVIVYRMPIIGPSGETNVTEDRAWAIQTIYSNDVLFALSEASRRQRREGSTSSTTTAFIEVPMSLNNKEKTPVMTSDDPATQRPVMLQFQVTCTTPLPPHPDDVTAAAQSEPEIVPAAAAAAASTDPAPNPDDPSTVPADFATKLTMRVRASNLQPLTDEGRTTIDAVAAVYQRLDAAPHSAFNHIIQTERVTNSLSPSFEQVLHVERSAAGGRIKLCLFDVATLDSEILSSHSVGMCTVDTDKLIAASRSHVRGVTSVTYPLTSNKKKQLFNADGQPSVIIIDFTCDPPLERPRTTPSVVAASGAETGIADDFRCTISVKLQVQNLLGEADGSRPLRDTVAAVYQKDSKSGNFHHLEQTDRVANTLSPTFERPIMFERHAPGGLVRLCVFDVPSIDDNITTDHQLCQCTIDTDQLVAASRNTSHGGTTTAQFDMKLRQSDRARALLPENAAKPCIAVVEFMCDPPLAPSPTQQLINGAVDDAAAVAPEPMERATVEPEPEPEPEPAVAAEPEPAAPVTTKTVVLTISCRDLPKNDFLSKSDPIVGVYQKQSGSDGNYTFVGKTEAQKNEHDPTFATTVTATVASDAELKVIVYDTDDDGTMDEKDRLGYAVIASSALVVGSNVERQLLDSKDAPANKGKAFLSMAVSDVVVAPQAEPVDATAEAAAEPQSEPVVPEPEPAPQPVATEPEPQPEQEPEPEPEPAVAAEPEPAAPVTTKTVVLTISCRDLPKNDFLSKSDPIVGVYQKQSGSDGNYTFVGKTEAQKNEHDPTFATTVTATVASDAELKVIVYDTDDDGTMDEKDRLGYAVIASSALVVGSNVERQLLDSKDAPANKGKAFLSMAVAEPAPVADDDTPPALATQSSSMSTQAMKRTTSVEETITTTTTTTTTAQKPEGEFDVYSDSGDESDIDLPAAGGSNASANATKPFDQTINRLQPADPDNVSVSEARIIALEQRISQLQNEWRSGIPKTKVTTRKAAPKKAKKAKKPARRVYESDSDSEYYSDWEDAPPDASVPEFDELEFAGHAADKVHQRTCFPRGYDDKDQRDIIMVQSHYRAIAARRRVAGLRAARDGRESAEQEARRLAEEERRRELERQARERAEEEERWREEQRLRREREEAEAMKRNPVFVRLNRPPPAQSNDDTEISTSAEESPTTRNKRRRTRAQRQREAARRARAEQARAARLQQLESRWNDRSGQIPLYEVVDDPHAVKLNESPSFIRKNERLAGVKAMGPTGVVNWGAGAHGSMSVEHDHTSGLPCEACRVVAAAALKADSSRGGSRDTSPTRRNLQAGLEPYGARDDDYDYLKRINVRGKPGAHHSNPSGGHSSNADPWYGVSPAVSTHLPPIDSKQQGNGEAETNLPGQPMSPQQQQQAQQQQRQQQIPADVPLVDWYQWEQRQPKEPSVLTKALADLAQFDRKGGNAGNVAAMEQYAQQQKQSGQLFPSLVDKDKDVELQQNLQKALWCMDHLWEQLRVPEQRRALIRSRLRKGRNANAINLQAVYAHVQFLMSCRERLLDVIKAISARKLCLRSVTREEKASARVAQSLTLTRKEQQQETVRSNFRQNNLRKCNNDVLRAIKEWKMSFPWLPVFVYKDQDVDAAVRASM